MTQSPPSSGSASTTQCAREGPPADSARRKRGRSEAVLAKAADVITYVENGVCDLGVVVARIRSWKTAAISSRSSTSGFGRCRFALACKRALIFFQWLPGENRCDEVPEYRAPVL